VIRGTKLVEEEYEYEDSQEYSIAEVSKNLPETLASELKSFTDEAGLHYLSLLNNALQDEGQLLQLVILSEYSILQFGILQTVIKDQELVLAEDAKNAVSLVASNLRLLSGHLELLLAPEVKH